MAKEENEVCPFCLHLGCFESCIQRMYEYYLQNYPEFFEDSKDESEESLCYKPTRIVIPCDYSDLPF